MDHKMVLATKLESFIDLASDNAVLPREASDISNFGWGSGSNQYSHSFPVQDSFLFSAKPRHPAFQHIVKLQIDNVQSKYYGPSALAVTGPLCYGLALDHYMSSTPHPKLDRSMQFAPGRNSLVATDFTLYDGSVIRLDGVFTKGQTDEILVGVNGVMHTVGRLLSIPYQDLWGWKMLHCDSAIDARAKKDGRDYDSFCFAKDEDVDRYTLSQSVGNDVKTVDKK